MEHSVLGRIVYDVCRCYAVDSFDFGYHCHCVVHPVKSYKHLSETTLLIYFLLLMLSYIKINPIKGC